MNKKIVLLIGMVAITIVSAYHFGLFGQSGMPVGSCDDMTIRCNPSNAYEVQYCLSNAWYTFTTCQHGICYGGGICPSESDPILCSEGATICNPGDSSQVLRCSNNKWVVYQNCAYGCLSGVCSTPTGTCITGTMRCSPTNNNVVEICSSNEWSYYQYCSESCYQGVCSTGEPTSGPPNIIEYREPTVSVSGQTVTTTVYIRNTGGDMAEEWLIEIQPRRQSLLSWIGAQTTCDFNNPQNVHRKYRLNSGESISMTFTTTLSSGTYDIVAVSADSCCVDGYGNTYPCTSTNPYNWYKRIDTVSVGSYCGDGVCSYDENLISCPEECSTVMSNSELTTWLQGEVRPLVGGALIQVQQNIPTMWQQCSLGAIVTRNGKPYILTAGHCVSRDTEKLPVPGDIGGQVLQGDTVIGSTADIDENYVVDAALIEFDEWFGYEFENYLGGKVIGFGSNVYVGQRVFKIGKTSGLTYGRVETVGIEPHDFDFPVSGLEYMVVGENGGVFADYGDSGAAIITAEKPYRVIGIVSHGKPILPFQTLDTTTTFSPTPENIMAQLNLDRNFY